MGDCGPECEEPLVAADRTWSGMTILTPIVHFPGQRSMTDSRYDFASHVDSPVIEILVKKKQFNCVQIPTRAQECVSYWTKMRTAEAQFLEPNYTGIRKLMQRLQRQLCKTTSDSEYMIWQ